MSKFEIKMPKLGESITSGTIVSCNVKVGDYVKEDDILFEISTEKVSAEIPSPIDGKVLAILFKEGDTVDVATTIAIIDMDAEQSDNADDTPPAQNNNKPEQKESQQAPVALAQPSKEKKEELDERWYSPVVKQKAKQAKISIEELDQIGGTGYQGRLTKKDIERYIDQKEKGISAKPLPKSVSQPAPVTPSPHVPIYDGDTVIEMDAVRKIISERMSQSLLVSAHVTSVIEVDVTNLVKWRKREKETFKKRENINLTFMPAIVEAVAKALRDFPRLNASVNGTQIIERKAVNIGIAVALPNGNLIVPVVKNADQKNIAGLANSINEVAEKARKGKLTPDDISGGTFTISNYGSYRSLFGTPIINQPEVAILGVGVIEKKPCVMQDANGDDIIAIRHRMYLALSHDHRIVDGALGSTFLKKVADYLEQWPL